MGEDAKVSFFSPLFRFLSPKEEAKDFYSKIFIEDRPPRDPPRKDPSGRFGREGGGSRRWGVPERPLRSARTRGRRHGREGGGSRRWGAPDPDVRRWISEEDGPGEETGSPSTPEGLDDLLRRFRSHIVPPTTPLPHYDYHLLTYSPTPGSVLFPRPRMFRGRRGDRTATGAGGEPSDEWSVSGGPDYKVPGVPDPEKDGVPETCATRIPGGWGTKS